MQSKGRVKFDFVQISEEDGEFIIECRYNDESTTYKSDRLQISGMDISITEGSVELSRLSDSEWIMVESVGDVICVYRESTER